MGQRGVKPVPTEILKMTGGYREDRHGNRADATPASGDPVMPRGLGKVGKKLWRRVISEHKQRGILGEVDSSALFACCSIWELLCAAMKEARAEPCNKDIRQAVTAYHASFCKASSAFGLSPADRANLKMSGKQQSQKKTGTKWRSIQ